MEYQLGAHNSLSHRLVENEEELEELFKRIADLLGNEEYPINKLAMGLDGTLMSVTWRRP